MDRRIKNSYEKYGWTPEQQEVFNKFVADRFAGADREKLTVGFGWREKMARVEELLRSMVKVPGFEKVMEEAVRNSEWLLPLFMVLN